MHKSLLSRACIRCATRFFLRHAAVPVCPRNNSTIRGRVFWAYGKWRFLSQNLFFLIVWRQLHTRAQFGDKKNEKYITVACETILWLSFLTTVTYETTIWGQEKQKDMTAACEAIRWLSFWTTVTCESKVPRQGANRIEDSCMRNTIFVKWFAVFIQLSSNLMSPVPRNTSFAYNCHQIWCLPRPKMLVLHTTVMKFEVPRISKHYFYILLSSKLMSPTSRNSGFTYNCNSLWHSPCTKKIILHMTDIQFSASRVPIFLFYAKLSSILMFPVSQNNILHVSVIRFDVCRFPKRKFYILL